ncbi:MAG: type II toxin-antitoxin system VapC family toxin [Acidimicrobiia bacterium]
MRLLLDTHIWLWALLEPDRLDAPTARRLEQADSELWLSPVSVWEAMLLAERGRLELDRAPGPWFEAALRQVPLRDAPLTREVAVASRSVGLAHEDPADRFLAATAQVYDLVLVTADERLRTGSGYQILR